LPLSRPDRQRGAAFLIVMVALVLLGASLVATLRYFAPAASLGRQGHVNAVSVQAQRALWAYAARNYALPCPADGTISDPTNGNYGVAQSAGAGVCTITGTNGVLPWKTLGIDKSVALDGWGNLIGYAVSGKLTNVAAKPYKTQSSATLNGSYDALKVSLNGAGATNQAYVLLSFGPEGGSYTGAGKQSAFQANASFAATLAQEQANQLPGAFNGASPFDAMTAKAGAVGGQWLVYENSIGFCSDLNGKSSTANYCSSGPTSPSCPGGACTLDNTTSYSSFAGATSNPNGVSSGATLVQSGLPGGMSVLALGTNGGNPLITVAPTLTGSSQACYWFGSQQLLTTGTFRAYFEFSTVGTTPGDGFTMTLLPAATSFANGTPCGGTPGGQDTSGGSGNVNEGSYVGFEQITDGGVSGSAAANGSRSSGHVSSISVSANGAGYLWTPPVEVSGSSTGNEASAYVSRMNVSGITVTYPGIGYIAAAGLSAAPNVIIAPAGGANYQAPPSVTIESAESTGCVSGCAEAAGTASITSGRVTSLTLTSAGSGYKRAPAVTIAAAASTGCTSLCADAIGASSAINGSTGAVTGLFISNDNCVQTSTCGAAAVSGMDVRAIALTAPGAGYTPSTNAGGLGYTSTPSVYIHGVAPGSSGGKNATAFASVNNGSVTAINVNNSGQSYVSNVIVTVAGGGIAYGTIQNINAGQVSDVQLADGGSGYPANSSVTFNLPAPLGCSSGCVTATAQANTDNMGRITGISVISGGAGYNSSYDKRNWAPVTDATHVPATVTPSISGGQIVALTLGSVAVVILPAAGDSPTATATASATVGSSGAITGLTLTNFGSGYTLVPTVSISAPTNCGSSCATATAQVTSMGVDTIALTSNIANETFTALPSIGIDPPSSSCSGSCFAAMAAANMTVIGITVANGGSGYGSAPTVSLPPPMVLPKLAVQFRTYHHPGDPYYSDYGYHDDWAYFGSATTSYATGAQTSSALMPATSAQESSAYRTLAGNSLPLAYGGTQGFGNNIRHDDNNDCDGVATSNCVPEYMGLLMVDAVQHDDTYHYSTNTGNSGMDNTAYTISPSCDSTPGANAALHDGGFVAGGASTGGALASTAAPYAGGCAYDKASFSNILTNNGPISDPQNGTSVQYHPVRVEVRRYCNSSCSSCGNQGAQGYSYVQVAAYLDCDSAALGGRSCSDLSQNLLVPGSQVFSVAVTSGGSGYSSVPAVTLSGGGGSGATATATIAGGKVSAVTVTAPGSGFTSAPTVSFSGGGATTNATATASISGLPLPASYAGGNVYAVNYCSVDPGATNWTSSQRGLSSLDQIIAGFTVGAGGATRGVLVRNVQLGTYN